MGIWEIELPPEERHHRAVRGPQDSCVPNNSALFLTALPLGSAPTPLPCFVTSDLHPRYISFTHVTWSRLVSRGYRRTLQEEGASLGFKTLIFLFLQQDGQQILSVQLPSESLDLGCGFMARPQHQLELLCHPAGHSHTLSTLGRVLSPILDGVTAPYT